MNKLLQITAATACGALLIASPASARMSSIEDEQYSESIQAARTLEKSKDWAKAKAKYGEAREEAVKGQDKQKEIKAISSIGAINLDQGDYPSAEAIFREALAIADGTSVSPGASPGVSPGASPVANPGGGLDPSVGEGLLASCLYDLSSVLIKEKRDSEAKPYFDRCIGITNRVFSANHPVLAVRTGEYAALLVRVGETEQGTNLASQSQAVINSFMDDMSAKIQKAWQPPPENFSYRLGVTYDVVNHGKIGKVEVTQSSGSPTADKAAIAAVKAGAPFSDITSTDLDYKVTLAFNFDYNHRNRQADTAYSGSHSGMHQAVSHQSKEVQAESETKVDEEKVKCRKLKEQIESLLKTNPGDATALANLYVQYAESLGLQGEQSEAASQLKTALDKDCFKSRNNPAAISLLIVLGHTYLSDSSLGNANGTLKEAIDAGAFSQIPLNLKQEALEDYGNCLSKSHKFAEAQEYYNRARELKQ